MRIAQVELTEGRFTVIPDMANWRSMSPYTVNGVDFKIGEYYGTDNTIDSYTGVWPIVEVVFKTTLTVDEFVNLFTPGELRKIRMLRDTESTDGDAINKSWYLYELRMEVDLESAEVETMLDILVASSAVPMFNAARKATILAGVPQ